MMNILKNGAKYLKDKVIPEVVVSASIGKKTNKKYVNYEFVYE